MSSSKTPVARPPVTRLLHVDGLKAAAAQLIVLHHLSAYGPVAEAVEELLPALMAWAYQYGRMAVQVFLVLGGFLTARALSSQGQLLEGGWFSLLARRYQRLALPFMGAVLLTLACSALVARWLPELVPAQVGWGQLLAHAGLVHGVLGYEALTVGAWYVAIDLQLFALLAGVLAFSRGLALPRAWRRWIGPGLVAVLTAASLLVFNRDSALDNWGLYFFGAYGLGALVHWLGLLPQRRLGLMLLAALGLAALLLDFRERIALALATALVLAWQQRRYEAGLPLLLAPPRLQPLLAHLGTHSYALFLVHFPICLLINALFERHDLGDGWPGLMAMLAAWGLSNLAAVSFYRWIEQPAGRLRLGALLARLWPRTLRA